MLLLLVVAVFAVIVVVNVVLHPINSFFAIAKILLLIVGGVWIVYGFFGGHSGFGFLGIVCVIGAMVLSGIHDAIRD